ncbi:sigma-70 family RNA polymerase sigma factor [Citreimonas salinaria]|uniref:DNA-directed RNA polymerase specialized sigma subunit n=1 Tax=Citreimonas salinaria TaxID=321339 RepID=A0A1H3N8D2_9RHOB|nr:sigma-70 family RNA polymerase sigma factor [Citreimonas salinaria]SDY84735.1 DNA-directed RNA polymerase specialized sigma subunit [Citreimonas salinaria]
MHISSMTNSQLLQAYASLAGEDCEAFDGPSPQEAILHDLTERFERLINSASRGMRNAGVIPPEDIRQEAVNGFLIAVEQEAQNINSGENPDLDSFPGFARTIISRHLFHAFGNANSVISMPTSGSVIAIKRSLIRRQSAGGSPAEIINDVAVQHGVPVSSVERVFVAMSPAAAYNTCENGGEDESGHVVAIADAQASGMIEDEEQRAQQAWLKDAFSELTDFEREVVKCFYGFGDYDRDERMTYAEVERILIARGMKTDRGGPITKNAVISSADRAMKRLKRAAQKSRYAYLKAA